MDIGRRELATDIGGGQCNITLTTKPLDWFFVPEFWPDVLPWIEAAVNSGGLVYRASDIYDALMRKEMTLWPIWSGERLTGCAVVHLVSYPALRSCCMFAMGGEDLREWAHLSLEVEKWAKERGAQAIEAPCRPGVGKVMKQFGWKEDCRIYRKLFDENS